MTVDPFPPLPPAPDPVQIAKWTGQVRLVLTLLAGAGIGAAWIPHLTDAQISAYVGVALLLFPIGASAWSWIENRWNARKANATVIASSVASAHATAVGTGGPATPVVVVPAPTIVDPSATASRPVLLSEIHTSALIVPLPSGP